MSLKEFFQAIFKAFIAIIFIGGTFHLTLLVIVGLKNANVSYINPIDFLGIGYAFPSLANNQNVAVAAWLILIAIYCIVLYLVIHYKRYLGLVKNTATYKKAAESVKKVTESTKLSSSNRKIPPPKE